jgi:predicted ribosome quality control (RQC) complex YloA/Tae2 family protein
MSLSRREIELLLDEIIPALTGGLIQKVFEGVPYHLVLQVRLPGQTHHLFIDLEPGQTRLHLVDDKPRQPQTPAAFTMLARKWLQGARIEAIAQAPEDRLVYFELSSVDPSWEPPGAGDDEISERPTPAPRVSTRLILELTGQHPNAFLVDDVGRILGRLHASHVGSRTLSTGTHYTPPEPPRTTGLSEEVRWHLDHLPIEARSARVASEFSRDLEAQRIHDLLQGLHQSLRKALRTVERRIGHIEADLQKIERAEDYRRYGELLQTAYGRVERGASSAHVPDYYAEGMPSVEIPLDPARSLQQNIDRYFHQYRRFKNAREKVEARLLEAMEQHEALQSACDELRSTPPELVPLQALAQRLEASRLLPRVRPAQERGSGSGAPARLPYRRFQARSGQTILVGKGARQNDALSTQIARGRDIWMHARDFAGAHVVLRMDRSDVPRSEDLLDAATLAAYFSRGREDTAIDVTYTLAKHVRKPKGFPPGRVSVAGGQTLTVRMDAERVQRLLDTEESSS